MNAGQHLLKPSTLNHQPLIRACSWESRQPPKLIHGVRILTLVLGKQTDPDGVTDGIGLSEGPDRDIERQSALRVRSINDLPNQWIADRPATSFSPLHQ